jgi:hypothetical protein
LANRHRTPSPSYSTFVILIGSGIIAKIIGTKDVAVFFDSPTNPRIFGRQSRRTCIDLQFRNQRYRPPTHWRTAQKLEILARGQDFLHTPTVGDAYLELTVIGIIMNPFEHFDELSECISRAIKEHLTKSNIDWSHELPHCILRVEIFLEDEGHRQGNVSPRSSQIASVRIKPVNPARLRGLA